MKKSNSIVERYVFELKTFAPVPTKPKKVLPVNLLHYVTTYDYDYSVSIYLSRFF